MNSFGKCFYCPAPATNACSCSSSLMCGKDIATHMGLDKDAHLILPLKKILTNQKKAKFTAKILKSLEKFKLFRSKILITSILLIDTIKTLSLNSLVALDSKACLYGRLLSTINNELTYAEIQEIKKQTKETLAYAEFDGYDQILSILKPSFNQEFSRAQVAPIFPSPGKEITQNKPRPRSRSPNARREEIVFSKFEKNIIPKPDNTGKIIQPLELLTDAWTCTQCTCINSALIESCKTCGYYKVKFDSDKNQSPTTVRDLLAPKSTRIWECFCGEFNPVVAARCRKCKGKKSKPTIDDKKCSICSDSISIASCPHCKEIVRMGEFCLKCSKSLNSVNICRKCIKRRFRIIG